MPFVVRCDACGKRLNIPDKSYEGKIRGRVVKIACKACGADVKVDGTRPRDEVDLSLQTSEPAAEKLAQKPEAKSVPRPEVTAAPTAAHKPETKSAPTAGPMPGARFAPKPEAKSAPIAGPKPGARFAPKPEANPAPRTETTPETLPTAIDTKAEAPLQGVASLEKPAPEGGKEPTVASRGETRHAAAAPPGASPTSEAGASAQARPAGGSGLGPLAGRPAMSSSPGLGARRPGLGLPRVGSGAQPKFGLPRPAAPGSRQDKPMSTTRGTVARPTSKSPPKPPTRDRAAGEKGPAKAESGQPEGAKTTFPGTPSAMGLAASPNVDTGFKPKAVEPAALRPFDEDEGGPAVGARAGGDSAPAEPGKVKPKPPAPLSKRTSPGTPEAISVLRDGAEPPDERLDGGVSDWLWAVSYDDDDDREMTLKEIEVALEAGEINGDTIVWREGMDEWKPLRQVEEFSQVLGVQSASSVQDEGPAKPAEVTEELEEIEDDDLEPQADSREAWRKSTADLLAELSAGNEDKGADGAEPVALHPGDAEPGRSVPAKAQARPAALSWRPSLIPKRGPGRIVAFVIVGLLVVLAVAGVVVLAFFGLAEDNDPTLGPQPLSSAAPAALSAGADEAVKPEPPATPSRSTRPSEISSADLANAVSESVGPVAQDDASGPKFDRKTAEQRFTEAVKRASACRPKNSSEQKGPARVQITFDPETGNVGKVRVFGRYANTKTGKCIELTVKAIHVKKFEGDPITLEQSVMVR